MNSIPKAAEPLIQEFADAFTRPTNRRFVELRLAAILTTGRRTVTNLLRTVSVPAPGHPSSYRRVFSKRRGSAGSIPMPTCTLRRRWFAGRGRGDPTRRARDCQRRKRS